MWAVAGEVFGAGLRGSATPAALAAFVLAFAGLTLGLEGWLGSPDPTLRVPLRDAALCLALVGPAVSARAFADDDRPGGWQVAAALPISPSERAVGAWLAVLAVEGLALALTAPWAVALAWLADPDPLPLAAGYLGVALLAAAHAAAGVAIAATWPSPAAAFLGALGSGLAPWALGAALPQLPGAAARALEPLSAEGALAPFLQGVLDGRAIAAPAAVTVGALALATHALARRPLR